MRVSAFRNASNKESYAVSKNGVAFDLNGAGIVRIEAVANGSVISSTNGDIVFSGSTLTIEWGALDLVEGTFSPIIYAYKTGDEKGEVLFAPTQSPILLNVIADTRP